jgi:hypothetical protein
VQRVRVRVRPSADLQLVAREHIELRVVALRTADGVVNERH